MGEAKALSRLVRTDAAAAGNTRVMPLLTGAANITWPVQVAALAPCRRRRHCTGVRTSGVACVRESAGELGPRNNWAQSPSLAAI